MIVAKSGTIEIPEIEAVLKYPENFWRRLILSLAY